MTEREKKALDLYRPPFRHEHGHILDSCGEMVSDQTMLRIRGWGRISHLENPEELQDDVGRLIAEALTRFWVVRYSYFDSSRPRRSHMTEREKKAFDLYRLPFRHEHGHILDSCGEMVSDQTMLRIRGWGRISHLENPEELQDDVGRLIAEALTRFWVECSMLTRFTHSTETIGIEND